MENAIEGTQRSLRALSEQYRTIAHNLANAKTVGFKRQVSLFGQALRAKMAPRAPQGAAPPTAAYAAIDFSPGTLTQTGRPLDVAVCGDGFLVVDTPDGPLYTRDGTMRANRLRQLVDSEGRTFAGTQGPVVLPEDASPSQIQIAEDGRIRAGEEEIGQLRLVEFDDPHALKPVGNNCFGAPPEAAPGEARQTTVRQGFQESSNVNTVRELVDLITVSRMYEANIKTVKMQDERMRSLLRAAMV